MSLSSAYNLWRVDFAVVSAFFRLRVAGANVGKESARWYALIKYAQTLFGVEYGEAINCAAITEEWKTPIELGLYEHPRAPAFDINTWMVKPFPQPHAVRVDKAEIQELIKQLDEILIPTIAFARALEERKHEA